MNNLASVMLQHLIQGHQRPNTVNTPYLPCPYQWCNIHILSGHTDDDNDDPHITEDVFFSCVGGHKFLYYIPWILKEEVLDECSLEILDSLSPPRVIIDRLHYVMFKIGKKENGLQIFYQCLKETQDRDSDHRYAVEILKKEGELRACYYRMTGFLCTLILLFHIHLCLAFSSVHVEE